MISSVNIAKNVYGGDGLGRLGDGRVVFVPGAWAGERVKAEIVDSRKGYVRARLVEVEDPSPRRLSAPEGPVVPGMVYANLSHEGELEAKASQLEEFLTRARIDHPRIVNLKTGLFANYRNKVVYHFDGVKIGYREEQSHRVVDVPYDPLALPQINAALGGIRGNILAMLTQGSPAVRKSVAEKGSVTIRHSVRSGVKWWLGKAPADMTLKETTCGKTFEVPAGGFYQVNPEAGDKLVGEVMLEYNRNRAATPEILDLYCGVGVFGICCNPERLTGVESGREAVDFARRNAVGMKDAFFRSGEVGRNLRRIRIGEGTCVIVDPPRGGMERGVPEWLSRSRAPAIMYVSCDPATLVRDLRIICRTYRVESVKWINMFPRTARFETLVVLKKC